MRPPLRRVNASAKLQYRGFREISEGMNTSTDFASAVSDFLDVDKQLFNWASSFTETTFGPILFKSIRAVAPKQGRNPTEASAHTEDAIVTLGGMYSAFAKDGKRAVRQDYCVAFC